MSAKTKIVLLAVMTAAIIIIVTALVFVKLFVSDHDHDEDTTAQTDEKIILPGKSEANAVKLTITKSGECCIYVKVGDHWENSGSAIGMGYIKTALEALEEFTFAMKLTNPARDDEYGFDNPTARVEAEYSDGSTLVFEIGDKNNSLDMYYVRINIHDGIYLCVKSIIEYFDFTGETQTPTP